MFPPINDIQLEDEQWLDHDPNSAAIGGVEPTEWELITDIPGQPHAIMLAAKGPAWATMEAYLPRPNFVAKGFPVQQETFTVTIGAKSVPHILEFDLITLVKLPDGTTWHFDGSCQINIPEGWMLQVDTAPPAPPKVPSWQDTGIKIMPLTFGVPHTVVITHYTNILAKTHSVVSVAVDGVLYPIPAAFHRIPATLSTWTPDESLIQHQVTAEQPGGMVDETFSTMSLQHRVSL